VPAWKRTVHCLGDLHVGAIAHWRLDAVRRDVGELAAPALHLQIGDATDGGTEEQDERALRFLEALPAHWVTALGNHDILRNKRTVAAWARVYGQESQNFSVDLDFARVILIGPHRTDPGKRAGRLSERTLAFLERELDEGPDDCWIACHYPLFRTVMGDPRRHFTSAMTAFHAKPDARIRELLAHHRNATVWLSGHTHSPLSAPGFIKRARLARRRTILSVSTSALFGLGRRPNPRAPLCSLYLTQRPGRLEIRARDHRAGDWRNIRGERVLELKL
jgi:3',5'-cyclic AMP phosphodiesterase CpdA